MDIEGRHVVVTGGASGIGRALVRAFAEAGARVVSGDVDERGNEELAALLSAHGLPVYAVPCDVARESDVRRLVTTAEERFGPVEVFCANAGVFLAGGPEVEDADWDRILAINVMSHVYALRALLPAMLARGEGYFVHTASAAGLLTQIGSLPYAVSKHAVVALAEWVSITYASAGIRVSCCCPQGVWTAMTGAAADRELVAETAGRDGMLAPETVAGAVLDAVRAERFLVLPHPEVADYELRRASDRERWLEGMRRMQARTFPEIPRGSTSPA